MDPTNGILIGEVIDLEDPEKLGRVKVKYPHLDNKPSDWAPLATPMAGPERGMFFRPEVGDEVLIGLLQRDPRWPYVIGSIWSKKDKPPVDDDKAKENNWRFFRSRSGHIFKFDDTKDAETIEIIDKDMARRIIIESKGEKIRIECDKGDIEIKATNGNITIVASKGLEVTADTIKVTGKKSLTVESKAIEMKANGNMTLEATDTLTIKGKLVNIN